MKSTNHFPPRQTEHSHQTELADEFFTRRQPRSSSSHPRWLSIVSIVSILLSSFPSFAQTNQLSGTLILPDGVVPTTQDLVFRIQTEQLDAFEVDGSTVTSSTDVTIPVLSSRAEFSLPLLDFPQVGLVEAQRRLKLDCLQGCANIAITTTGYWGGIQGIVGRDDAQLLDSGLSQSVTINLERADFFRGVINFPDTFTAAGNELLSVNVTGSQFSNPPTFSQALSPSEGDQSISFFIGVPPSQTGGSWLLSLECVNCDETLPEGPYFPTTSAGDPLSTSSAERFFHLKNRSYSNLRFTLPSPPRQIQATPLPGIILLLSDDD